MKEYIVYQTQHRLKFDEDLARHAKDGWELMGPVQFSVHPDKNACYYLATFVREAQ